MVVFFQIVEQSKLFSTKRIVMLIIPLSWKSLLQILLTIGFLSSFKDELNVNISLNIIFFNYFPDCPTKEGPSLYFTSQDPVFLLLIYNYCICLLVCCLSPTLYYKLHEYRIICLSYSPLISQCIIHNRSLTIICLINERKRGEITLNCWI